MDSASSPLAYIERQLPAFRRKEFARNCLITATVVTLLTLMTGIVLGSRNIGPFQKIASFEPWQKGVLFGSTILSGFLFPRMGVSLFFSSKMCNQERLLLLPYLKNKEKCSQFGDAKSTEDRWFAFRDEHSAKVTIPSGNVLIVLSKYNRVDYNDILPLTTLRIRRAMVDPFYSIGLVGVILISIGIAVKIKGDVLQFTATQGKKMLISGAVISGLSLAILGWHKMGKLPGTQYLSQEDFSSAMEQLPKKPA